MVSRQRGRRLIHRRLNFSDPSCTSGFIPIRISVLDIRSIQQTRKVTKKLLTALFAEKRGNCEENEWHHICSKHAGCCRNGWQDWCNVNMLPITVPGRLSKFRSSCRQLQYHLLRALLFPVSSSKSSKVSQLTQNRDYSYRQER